MADEWDEFSTPISSTATRPNKGAPAGGSEWDEFSSVVGRSKGKPAASESTFLGMRTGNQQKAIKPLIEPPQWLQNWLGKPEDSPSPNTILRQMGKGIPILGRYIPENEETKRAEQEYPITSTVANVTGGTMATLPLAGGMTVLTGTKFLPQLAGQMALGAGLSAGDTVAEKGGQFTTQDILKSLMTGGASGAVGPVAGKLITPTSSKSFTDFQAKRSVFEKGQEMAEAAANARLNAARVRMQAAEANGDPAKIAAAKARLASEEAKFHKAGTQAYAQQMAQPYAPMPAWMGHFIDAGVGGATGYAAFGHPGALAGGLISTMMGKPSGAIAVESFAKTAAGKKWFENQLMANSNNAAILNALGHLGAPYIPDAAESASQVLLK